MKRFLEKGAFRVLRVLVRQKGEGNKKEGGGRETFSN